MGVANILAEKGRDVVSMAPDASIREAVKLLNERKIGAIVVTDGSGGILGILSERDVVRHLALSGGAVLEMIVGRVMTAKVQTCKPEESIETVMARMTRGRFRHLPVEEGGKLAGIISIGDVVKRRIEDIEREADDIRSYIAMA